MQQSCVLTAKNERQKAGPYYVYLKKRIDAISAWTDHEVAELYNMI